MHINRQPIQTYVAAYLTSILSALNSLSVLYTMYTPSLSFPAIKIRHSNKNLLRLFSNNVYKNIFKCLGFYYPGTSPVSFPSFSRIHKKIATNQYARGYSSFFSDDNFCIMHKYAYMQGAFFTHAIEGGGGCLIRVREDIFFLTS